MTAQATWHHMTPWHYDTMMPHRAVAANHWTHLQNPEPVARMSYGPSYGECRLYLKNLPLSMPWWSVSRWVESVVGVAPTWVHVNTPGCDMVSAFVHFNVTDAQLQHMAMLLNGHYLTHRPTFCQIARPPPRVSWLKETGTMLPWHVGSCRGRGRKRGNLFYHGVIRTHGGAMVRGECPCCQMPWPPCHVCFETWLVVWLGRITFKFSVCFPQYLPT